MKFAICKDESIYSSFDDSTYVFSLYSKKKSTIYSNLYNLWRRISPSVISPVYEDLFVFGLSVFAIDKRMSRSLSRDNWTRTIDVSIPVSNVTLWRESKYHIEQMLSFLTGDKWTVDFYPSTDRFALDPIRRDRVINFEGYDSVCLFSGGLDSFCGAITLAEGGRSTCLVGHNEYPKLSMLQKSMAKAIQEKSPTQKINFYEFTANSHAPKNKEKMLKLGENTCRSRSILFLCAAVSLAGIISNDTPIFIPENGFISINVPLTQSRSGSCSTRTTHPFFVDCYRKLLHNLGLTHEIINPFEYMTKREVVDKVKNTSVFLEKYSGTISCSHPCNPRWKGLSYPQNCGYCYPCIIRKTSLMDIEQGNEGYSSLPFTTLEELLSCRKDTANDLKAILASVHRYCSISDQGIMRLISTTGPIKAENLGKHLRVYKETMEDLRLLLDRELNYSEV